MFKNLAIDRPMAVFDLETTGTDTANDRIVEISVLRLEPDGSNAIKTRRFNPGMPIPPGATAVHKITDEDVAGEPPFAKYAKGLARFLDGCDLCGFNLLKFDIKLLMAEFARAGVPFSVEGRRFLDPCQIYHAREKRDLTAAVRFYCGRDHEGAHGAEADVLAALAVLDAQVGRYGDLPRTVGELHEHMRDPAAVDFEGKFARRDDGVVVFNFSADPKGRPVDDVAGTHPGFLRWMLKMDFMPDAKAVAAEGLARAGEAVSRAYTS
jgi:DNA polymerase-3 subunit epsilon